MPNPQVKDVHIDQFLTNFSIAYSNKVYLARQVFPLCKVDKESDKFAIFGKENFDVDVDTKRAAGKLAREVDWTLSSDSYSCIEHALAKYIPKRVEDNADQPINPRLRTTKLLNDRLLLREEYELVTKVTDTGVITQNTTLSGTGQWSDYTNSDPVANVQTGASTINKATSIDPMDLVLFMGFPVWDKLRNHTKLISRIQYSALGVVTANLMAELFDVKAVVVSSCLKNTAKKGQTSSLDYVWGKDALLCYVPSNPALEEPAFGYTFHTVIGESRSWWDDGRKSTGIEVANIRDQKLCDAKAAYLIKAAVA